MTFYVYELVDPRTDSVFYVGKGKCGRIDAHEKEARSGAQTPKCQAIRDIEADGHSIIKRKVRWFSDEQDAYDFEASHIHGLGWDTLTNIAPGGGVARGSITRAKDAENARACAEVLNRTRNGQIGKLLVARQVLDLLPILAEYREKLRDIAERRGWDWADRHTAPFGVRMVA